MSAAAMDVSKKLQATAPWWEILLVMALTLGISLFFPALKVLAVLLPVAYLIAERFLRRRSWTSSGFGLKRFPQELVRNFGWVLLVGVGTQALGVFGTHWLLPDYAAHVIARLPFQNVHDLGPVVNGLLVTTLGEEVIFRGLFQKRTSAFLPVPAAILLTSLVFALMHYAPGPFLIVFVDLALVVVDSLIYGIIFARSNNVFVSWAAHFLADVCGMAFLLIFLK